MRVFILLLAIVLLFADFSQADTERKWARDDDNSDEPVHIFSSTDAVNLPTAETLQKRNMEFIINHRFYPPIADGYSELYGFDGPANIQFGLAFGLLKNLTFEIARSNLNDNLDLNLKFGSPNFKLGSVQFKTAVMGGMGWNYETFTSRPRSDVRNFQYYGQFIINAMARRNIYVGFVPSILYNSSIFSPNAEITITLGGYLQYYITSKFSLLGEINPAVSDFHRDYNSGSVAIVLETGGHFFKIIATNSVMMNLSQYLSGADNKFDGDQLRIGFSITRLLKY